MLNNELSHKKRHLSNTGKSIEYWIYDINGFCKKIKPSQFKHVNVEDRTTNATIATMNKMELSRYNFGVSCDINKLKRERKLTSDFDVRRLIAEYIKDRYSNNIKYL